MNLLYLYLTTPFLGFLKNYIKYKQCKPLIFIRTPIIYILLQILLQTRNHYKIMIYERWFFFMYKMIQSYINDDYHKKKLKYMKKYQLTYNET